jgi:hypothetical protein
MDQRAQCDGQLVLRKGEGREEKKGDWAQSGPIVRMSRNEFFSGPSDRKLKSNLKMEAACFSETFVYSQKTKLHNSTQRA